MGMTHRLFPLEENCATQLMLAVRQDVRKRHCGGVLVQELDGCVQIGRLAVEDVLACPPDNAHVSLCEWVTVSYSCLARA
jgi:hypothetical protein